VIYIYSFELRFLNDIYDIKYRIHPNSDCNLVEKFERRKVQSVMLCNPFDALFVAAHKSGH
jgi:hypothetical protein